MIQLYSNLIKYGIVLLSFYRIDKKNKNMNKDYHDLRKTVNNIKTIDLDISSLLLLQLQLEYIQLKEELDNSLKK